MPRGKTQPVSQPGSHLANGPQIAEILTLGEAAAYLRIAEEEVLRMTREQGLPGRQIGPEWRFLKAALQAWLSVAPPKSGKAAFLAMAGKFKDDPFLEEIVREAYRQRGRPITEEPE